MNIANLHKIVTDTEKQFSPLVSPTTHRNPVSGVIQNYNQVHAPTRNMGKLRGTAITPQDFWNKVPANPIAVVARCDDSCCRTDRDIPVILTIGINYGQLPTTATTPPIPCDNTKMAGNLNAVLSDCGETRKCPEDCHLIASNFFPWITSTRWSDFGFNSIEEALFLDFAGFKDPFAHLHFLIQQIGSDLDYIAFHGANNAVPYLGVRLLHTLQIAGHPPKVIFCNNLAYPPGGNIVRWNF